MKDNNKHYENKFLHSKFKSIFNKNSADTEAVHEVMEDSIKIILSGYNLNLFHVQSNKTQKKKLKLEVIAFLKYVILYEDIFLFNPDRVVTFGNIEGAIKSYDIKELEIAVGYFW